MRVVANNTVSDAEHQFIAIELSEADKQNIANMDPEATLYMCWPDYMSKKASGAKIRQAKNLLGRNDE